MKVSLDYRIQGGINKNTLLRICTEMSRLVATNGSDTGRVILQNLLALARDYTILKENRLSEATMNETLEQMLNISSIFRAAEPLQKYFRKETSNHLSIVLNLQ